MSTEQPTSTKSKPPNKSMNMANAIFILAFLPFGIEFWENPYGTFIVLVHLFGDFLIGPGPFGPIIAFLVYGFDFTYQFLFVDWILGGVVIFVLNLILYSQLRSLAKGYDKNQLITILAMVIIIASVAIFFLRNMIPLPLMALAALAGKSAIKRTAD